MEKKIVKKQKPLARVNTRIRGDQRRFIKTRAKRENLTEGEVFRFIIDYYITDTK